MTAAAVQAMGEWWDENTSGQRNPFTHVLHGDGVRADWCPLHGGTADPLACKGFVAGFPCPGDPPMPGGGRVERATWLHLILVHRTRLETPGDDDGTEFNRVADALLDAAADK